MQRTTLDLPNDLAERYEELAQQTGQSREAMMVEALAAYLAQVAEGDARLEAAIAAADRGEVVDADEADAEMEAWLLGRGITPEQLAAIGEETRREAEAFYGCVGYECIRSLRGSLIVMMEATQDRYCADGSQPVPDPRSW